MTLCRPIRSLMAMLAVPALLAVQSCNSIESPEDDPIAVFIEIDKPTLSQGEIMSVTVRARNVGLESATLTGPSDCLLYFDVYSTDGNRLFSSAEGCSGGTVTETIAPGANRQATVSWDGRRTSGERLHGTFHMRPVALMTGKSVFGQTVTVLVE